MAKYKILQDKGVDIYPVTHPDAVRYEDGTSIGEVVSTAVKSSEEAASSAAKAETYLGRLETAIQSLPDGQAVSAKVAENTAKLGALSDKIGGNDTDVADMNVLAGAFNGSGVIAWASSGFYRTPPIAVKHGDVFKGVGMNSTSNMSVLSEVSANGDFISKLVGGNSTTGANNYEYAIPKDCYVSISGYGGQDSVRGIAYISRPRNFATTEELANVEDEMAGLRTELYGGRGTDEQLDLTDTKVGVFSIGLGYSLGDGRTLFYYAHRGEEFRIVAKDKEVQYAWLPKNTYVDGEIASAVDGKTQANVISAGATSVATCPSDSYLAVRMNGFSGSDLSPQSITKLGSQVKGDIPSLDERVSAIEGTSESYREQWNNLPTANGAWSFNNHDRRWTDDFKSVLNIKVKAGDVFVGKNILSTSSISLITEVDESGAYIDSYMQGSDNGRRDYSYVFTKDAIVNISLVNADVTDTTKGFILHFTKMGLLSHFMRNYLGKSYATLGDSITFRGHWQQIVNYYTGMGFKNYACSGMVVGGFGFLYPNGGSESSSSIGGAVATRLLKASDFEGCSYIIICGYANNMYANAGQGTPLGTMGDSFISMSEEAAAQASSVNAYRQTITAQDFIPQIKSTIDYISRIAPSVKIIVAGALQMSSSQAPGFHATNGNGLTTEDYSEAMKKVAEWYGLPYIDLEHNGGVNGNNSSIFYDVANDVHPNYRTFDGDDFPTSGMKRMGELIAMAL